jgi:hypothetical protein
MTDVAGPGIRGDVVAALEVLATAPPCWRAGAAGEAQRLLESRAEGPVDN